MVNHNSLPFGAVYIIEQELSDKDVQRDLDNIQNTGFNTITLWPLVNSWLAKSPDEFVFDYTRQVLDYCEQRGLKALLQLIGQNQSQEYMPDCLIRPEMYALYPRNCYWANPNHPEVDKCVYNFFKQAIPALKDHPAVYAWDVFNEARLNTDDPWTTKLYQQWLEKKYVTIENLNRLWYRRYRDFTQINPADRNAAYSLWSSMLPTVEYERFRSENLTDICRRYVNYAKEFDNEHPILVDGMADVLLSGNVTTRNTDEFDLADTCDIYGATFYPKSWGNKLYTPPNLSLFYSLSADAAKEAGKPFFISEIQTHTTSPLSPGSEVSPERLYSWVLAGFACGAKGLQLWRWSPFLHGYQSTGRGVTHIDGTPGPRSEAMKKISAIINKHGRFLASANPVKPAVKIVSSYRSRLFFDSFLNRPPTTNVWGESHHSQALIGWFKVFWSSGIPTNFTELRCVENGSDAAVLVLPSLVSCSNDCCRRLAKFVKNGGNLIADARLRIVDENGVVPSEGIPGSILSEVMGFKEIDVDGPVEFDFCGEKVTGAFMSQQLEPAPDAEILGRTANGYPMAISHKFGKGSSLYFAAFMGQTWQGNLTEKQKKFFRQHIFAIAPKTPWADKTDNVIVFFHQTDVKQVVYIINMGPESEKVRLHNVPAKENVYDLISEKEISGGNIIETTLDGWQSQILSWDIVK